MSTCVPTNVSATTLPPIWDWEGWVMIVDLIIMFVILFFDIIPTDFTMLLALMIPMYCQIITTTEALEGFSNAGVLSVAVLFVVAEGLTSTGALEFLMNRLLGRPQSISLALSILMLPVGFASAFMNNTPIVAIMIPILKNWTRKVRFPVGQFMLPLSYATIFGGTCTLIGTSTNLVVAGRSEQYYCQSIPFFALTPVGVPLAFVGFSYIILTSQRLLSNRDGDAKMLSKEEENESSYFVVHCIVDAESAHVGQVPNALLLHQPSISLRFLHRAGMDTIPISAKDSGSAELPEIQSKDILTFNVEKSQIDTFPQFCVSQGFQLLLENQQQSGDDEEEDAGFKDAIVVQVAITQDSHLEDRTPKEVHFRSTYNAAILSVFRQGEKLVISNLGEIILKVGDVLVLLINDAFSWSHKETKRDLKPKPIFAPDSPSAASSVNGDECWVKEEDFGVEREFQISMRISETSALQFSRPLGGRTIEQAGLRGLPGLFLIAVSRQQQQFFAVGSDFVLQPLDVVYFLGDRNSIATLRRIPGLEDVEHVQIAKLGIAPLDRRLVECVLSLRSDLINKTIKESRFRNRFNAAIVAIRHADGKKLQNKQLGGVVLRSGDILILDTGPDFIARYRNDDNFLLVSEIEDSTPPRFKHFYLALFCVVVMMVVVVVADKYVSLVLAALSASAVMLLFKVLTPHRARQSISWNVIVTIAAAFGISTALENSLVAPIIGQALVSLAEITNTGESGVIVCVYLATMLLSIVVANNAAAVLMFPIAAQAANSLGVNPSRILLALMFAASASFMTPFGYQTNLMVMEPGKYVFKDYVKFGGPLQFLVFIVTCIFIIFDLYWYIYLPLSIVWFGLAFAFQFSLFEKHGWKNFGQLFVCDCCRRASPCCGKGSSETDEKKSLPQNSFKDAERMAQVDTETFSLNQV